MSLRGFAWADWTKIAGGIGALVAGIAYSVTTGGAGAALGADVVAGTATHAEKAVHRILL